MTRHHAIDPERPDNQGRLSLGGNNGAVFLCRMLANMSVSTR